LRLLQSLVDKTLGGKEGDEDLKAVTALAGVKAAGLALGSFSHGGASMAPDMVKMAPRHLRNFLLTDEETAYEWSLSSESAEGY
jgi:hypothetical protein